MRAAIYARQSRERQDESEASVQAQIESCQLVIGSRGWKHTATFSDQGISGYDPKAVRPDFEAMMESVRRRELDVIVVYSLSRLTRRGVIEANRIVGELIEHGATMVSATEPFLDLSTPIGRGIFSLISAMAEQESYMTSSRVTTAKSVIRKRGGWNGGVKPYAMDTRREMVDGVAITVLVPGENASVVRTVVDNVMNGASVNSEAQRLNREGIPASNGGQWTRGSLMHLLRHANIAGIAATRRGGIERDSEGAPIEIGEGIISIPRYFDLQLLLDSRTTRVIEPAKMSLLGGLPNVKCGNCGGKISANHNNANGGNYKCQQNTQKGRTACPGVSVTMNHADEYVSFRAQEAFFMADEDSPKMREIARLFNMGAVNPEIQRERDRLTAVIQDAQTALEELDADRIAGVFRGEAGTARYRRQAIALADRLESAQAELEALPTESDDPTAVIQNARKLIEFWGSSSIQERREFITLWLEDVTILPANGDRGRFKAERRFSITPSV